MDTELTIQNQAIEHARNLLIAHWSEAKESADENGKFSIGLRISVQDGASAKNCRSSGRSGQRSQRWPRRGRCRASRGEVHHQQDDH